MADSYRLSKEEFDSVSGLDGGQRYRHFVKRVADWETVWGLRDAKGWVAAGDNEGKEGFVVWLHPEYALACAKGEWNGNQATSIDVHEFVESWLPDMAEKQVNVVVFPITDLKGVVVPAQQLQEDLRTELSQYE